MLLWAREESGYPLERVAKKLNVKVDRAAAWEQSEGPTPTMRQIRELSKFYHRPLSLFFQAKPPKLAPLASEYRRLPGVEIGHESPELRLAVRQMSIRREQSLNLIEELGDTIPDFNLKAKLNEDPAVVAERLRKALGISLENQLAWRDEWLAWRRWREAVDGLGVLVFHFFKVRLAEARGLSLLKFPMPVVGINNKENVPGSKSYTLVHELIHLMLAHGHEEVPALKENRNTKQWEGVERFAEAAASHVLVPEVALRNAALRNAAGPKHGNVSWDIAEVRKLAKQFRISPLAMATRLRASGYMTWTGYNSWKGRWNDYVKDLKPRSGGISSQADQALNRAGRPFVQLVLEALDANRLTALDASRYLNLKFKHFVELRTNLRMSMSRSNSDG